MSNILLKIYNWLVPRYPKEHIAGVTFEGVPKWKPVWVAALLHRKIGWYESYQAGNPFDGGGGRRDCYAMWKHSNGDFDAPLTKDTAWCFSVLEYYPRWTRNDFLRLCRKMDGDKWL